MKVKRLLKVIKLLSWFSQKHWGKVEFHEGLNKVHTVENFNNWNFIFSRICKKHQRLNFWIAKKWTYLKPRVELNQKFSNIWEGIECRQSQTKTLPCTRFIPKRSNIEGNGAGVTKVAVVKRFVTGYFMWHQIDASWSHVIRTWSYTNSGEYALGSQTNVQKGFFSIVFLQQTALVVQSILWRWAGF